MDREITIVVSEDEARRIDERVAAGEFGSAAELAHAAVASFVGPVEAPLSGDFIRRLIQESDDDDPGLDVDGGQFRAALHQHIEATIARRNGKA